MDQETQSVRFYQGQFGNYTITSEDLQGVRFYRLGLAISALAFAGGTGLSLASSAQQALSAPDRRLLPSFLARTGVESGHYSHLHDSPAPITPGFLVSRGPYLFGDRLWL
jgi:hypothetical protein